MVKKYFLVFGLLFARHIELKLPCVSAKDNIVEKSIITDRLTVDDVRAYIVIQMNERQ